MFTVKLADEVYELLDWEPPPAKLAASVASPTGTLADEQSGAAKVGGRVLDPGKAVPDVHDGGLDGLT